MPDTLTTGSVSTKQAFLDRFETQSNLGLLKSTNAIKGLRERSIQEFTDLGIPTGKVEYWKYNKLNKVFSGFDLAAKAESSKNIDLSDSAIPGLDCYEVVIVNGQFNAELSKAEGLEAGLKITDLSEASLADLGPVAEKFSTVAKIENRPFLALNTALQQGGVVVEVAAEASISKPVLIRYISNASEKAVIFPRALIICGDRSKAQIVETWTSNDQDVFTIGVTEILTGASSNIEHFKLQDESEGSAQISATSVYQKDNSTFKTNTLINSGSYVRNNLTIHPDGEGCDTHLNGLYLTKDDQFVDNHTYVDHARPNCESHELYKGILDGSSTGIFNGKLFVRVDAQKTNAFQSSRSLLLSDDASVNSKPELEIYADDVKCSHGATTGHLDDDAVFYFRARGIPDIKARNLLLHAFAEEVTGLFDLDAFRDFSDKLVAEYLD